MFEPFSPRKSRINHSLSSVDQKSNNAKHSKLFTSRTILATNYYHQSSHLLEDHSDWPENISKKQRANTIDSTGSTSVEMDSSTSSSDEEGDFQTQGYERLISKDTKSIETVFSPTSIGGTTPIVITAPINKKKQTQEIYHTSSKDFLKETQVLFDCNQRGTLFTKTDISLSSLYESVGTIDSGNFSDVYKVQEKNSNNPTIYALKRYKRPFKSRRDKDSMFNEVEMVARVTSTNSPLNQHIIQVYKAWQEDSILHMLFEHAPHGSLKDLITLCTTQNKVLSISSLYLILHDLLAGLSLIHSLGVVHLDIKPANILISEDGGLKIADFGLATLIGSGDYDREGDCRYMSRELLNDSSRQASADMFSLGLTLYEMCHAGSSSGSEVDYRTSNVSSSSSSSSSNASNHTSSYFTTTMSAIDSNRCTTPNNDRCTTPVMFSSPKKNSYSSPVGKRDISTPRKIEFSLPLDGQEWQDLRDGIVSFPEHITYEPLMSLITSLLRPTPQDRPSAEELMREREVQEIGEMKRKNGHFEVLGDANSSSNSGSIGSPGGLFGCASHISASNTTITSDEYRLSLSLLLSVRPHAAVDYSLKLNRSPSFDLSMLG